MTDEIEPPDETEPMELELELDDLPEPPTPDHVAERATLAFALAMRGLLEQDAGTDDAEEAEMIRSQMSLGISKESRLLERLAKEERELLEAPIGGLDPDDADEAIWWSEQGQVLLWALERRDLPPHDEQEHPFEVAKSTGVISNVGGIPTNWLLLRSPRLRSVDEILAMESALAAILQRLEDYAESPANPVDLQTALTELAPLPIPVLTIERDLAIHGVPITQAEPGDVAVVTEIAGQRLWAIEWLLG